MPESARIRRILGGDQCFVVVQDLFLTETAELADVVLPAAGWGEKTGCFTNVNRTVHLSEKAVDPPGEARSDLDIFLMYADAMGFTEQVGGAADRLAYPRGGLRRLDAATAGRPVDYTGLSYDRLRGPTGIPWPVNEEHPDGTDRLYADGVFPTDTDYCETYGHDLAHRRHGHRDRAPGDEPCRPGVPEGRGVHPGARGAVRGLSAAVHDRPHRLPVPHPHQDRPLRRPQPGGAGRVGRALATQTPRSGGSEEGDWVRVASPRGAIDVRARVGNVMEGAVFAPFHYGRWEPDADSAAVTRMPAAGWPTSSP